MIASKQGNYEFDGRKADSLYKERCEKGECCRPFLWKLLISIISEKFYDHLNQKNL